MAGVIMSQPGVTEAEKAASMRCIGVDLAMLKETGIMLEVLPETATGQKS